MYNGFDASICPYTVENIDTSVDDNTGSDVGMDAIDAGNDGYAVDESGSDVGNVLQADTRPSANAENTHEKYVAVCCSAKHLDITDTVI